MTTNFANKTSLKVPYQLPEFIRSDDNYQTFVAFIQAYYEWLEQQDIGNGKEGAIYGSQNLLNFRDIDYTEAGESFNKFIDYYINDFLPNFPKEALADKAKMVKIARRLYETKGTPASYQFLFRALYNSDTEIFMTRDVVLRASDGKWYVSKSLRLATNDEQWLSINNLRLFGKTSKSIATVERSVAVGNRTEVYITNIERLFQSGEDVIVVDNNNQPLYFKDGQIVANTVTGSEILEAKILGSISSVNINNKKRGQLYVGRSSTYSGDPVVFYGGLKTDATNPIGAEAYVYETTTGSLRDIVLEDGSYGYRPDPNTYIQIKGGGGSGAIANVGSVDPAGEINVAFIAKDYLATQVTTSGGSTTAKPTSIKIGGTGGFTVTDIAGNNTIYVVVKMPSTTGFTTGDKITIIGANSSSNLNGTKTITVANSTHFKFTQSNVVPTAIYNTDNQRGMLLYKGTLSNYTLFPANANSDLTTTLANGFSFTNFSTYPIASILLNNGGGGFSKLPTVTAQSLYDTNDTQPVDSLKVKGQLGSLGILGPIEIVTPGTGYANGDIVYFTNSAGGAGANANVKVNATGSIISATYNYANTGTVIKYPKGGLGYRYDALPTLGVTSSGGSGAVLRVNTVLGAGAKFTPIADERGIGAITSFIIENYGEDYISAPSVSLRVRDLVVTNVSLSNLVKSGELIYQGSNVNTAVFKAYVDSISLLEAGANTAVSKFLLRTYNYTSNTKTDLQLKVTDRDYGPNIYLDLATTYTTTNTASGEYIFNQGIRTYGNGAAVATAKFLNGLIIGTGQYINDDGFLSSNQILENEDYNNFTYELIVQKSFDAYKDVLYKLLHPSGTKVRPINALKSEETVYTHRESFESNSHTLSYFTGTTGSVGEMYSTFESPSNNIIRFTSLAGANIAQFINVGAKISLSSSYGPNVYSEVLSVSGSSNTLVIQDNVFLSFANVATANVVSGNNRINIIGPTGQYDIINNGQYSNTQNKIRDIIFVGDRIRVVNGSSVFHGTVSYISYSNNVIFANTTLGFSASSANISIGRTLSTNDVNIYNSLGTVFYPELTTQDNKSLTTQDGKILLLG